MYQLIKFFASTVVLSVFLFNFVQAEDTSPVNKLFNTKNEAIAFAQSSGKIFHAGNVQIKGISDGFLQSLDKAIEDATAQAKKAGGLFYIQGRETIEELPVDVYKGRFSRSTQTTIALNSFSLIDLTPENLLAEIKSSRDGYLFDYANKSEFKSLTKEYKEIVRARNSQNAYDLKSLVRLIVLHDGKDCAEDLIKWAKYHESPSARLASYLGLIQLGKTSDVEEILKTEADASVKQKVRQALI